MRDFYDKQIYKFDREPDIIWEFQEDITDLLQERAGSEEHGLLKEWILWKASRLSPRDLDVLRNYVGNLRKEYNWEDKKQIFELWAGLQNIQSWASSYSQRERPIIIERTLVYEWRENVEYLEPNFAILWGKVWRYEIVASDMQPLWWNNYEVTLKWRRSMSKSLGISGSMDFRFNMSYDSRLGIITISNDNGRGSRIDTQGQDRVNLQFKLNWKDANIELKLVPSHHHGHWRDIYDRDDRRDIYRR